MGTMVQPAQIMPRMMTAIVQWRIRKGRGYFMVARTVLWEPRSLEVCPELETDRLRLIGHQTRASRRLRADRAAVREIGVLVGQILADERQLPIIVLQGDAGIEDIV